jgi:ATP-dependent Lon protease
MPEGNRKDTEELPKEVKSVLNFIFCGSVLEALGQLFPDR